MTRRSGPGDGRRRKSEAGRSPAAAGRAERPAFDPIAAPSEIDTTEPDATQGATSCRGRNRIRERHDHQVKKWPVGTVSPSALVARFNDSWFTSKPEKATRALAPPIALGQPNPSETEPGF